MRGSQEHRSWAYCKKAHSTADTEKDALPISPNLTLKKNQRNAFTDALGLAQQQKQICDLNDNLLINKKLNV